MATHSSILAWRIPMDRGAWRAIVHKVNGHEFEQTPGASEGQGSLVCCSPWGHLLAVQGTLKSFLQHHSLKASILWHSAFLIKCVFEGHCSVTANILDKTDNKLITASYIGFPY